MTLTEGSKEVVGEMIKIQQLLRRTSPAHMFSEDERKQVLESVGKAQQSLEGIAKGVKPL